MHREMGAVSGSEVQASQFSGPRLLPTPLGNAYDGNMPLMPGTVKAASKNKQVISRNWYTQRIKYPL